MRYTMTNGQDRNFNGLCILLDESLEKLTGHVIDRSKYKKYNTTEKIHDVVLVYDGEVPVGCAGLRHYENSVAEVKRVFVREDYRGRGISKELMALLEKKASEKGYTALILETGAALVCSLGLYRGIGYQVIDNYGPYRDMKESVCMRKMLV